MIINHSIYLASNLFEQGPDYTKIIGEKSGDWKVNLLYNYDHPKVGDLVDRYLAPGMKYNVFDTTCHIMMELARKEQHGIFDPDTIDDLAKIAYKHAEKELQARKISCTEESISALAIWNLLLPYKKGGVYPDEQYSEFVLRLTRILQDYKSSTNMKSYEFTPEILQECFLEYKSLVKEFYTLDHTKLLKL